jgi:hypothetical protein
MTFNSSLNAWEWRIIPRRFYPLQAGERITSIKVNIRDGLANNVGDKQIPMATSVDE